MLSGNGHTTSYLSGDGVTLLTVCLIKFFVG